MSVGDWSAATLCVYSDVVLHYERVYELTDETVEASQQAEVTAWIARAKEDIGIELDGIVKQYYADNLGSYSTSDDLKDKISNPEQLKHAAIALTLAKMFANNVNVEGDFNHVRQKEWEKKYQKYFNIAVGLLRFDKDDDGSISDDELAQGIGSNRFVRV